MMTENTASQSAPVEGLVMSDFRDYCGLTYPTLLIRWRWQEWLWRKLFCSRHIHLFDEVLSSGDDPWPHYLHCDACNLIVNIDSFEDDWVET
tara:strand:- start:54 stop:329 length:276 start_codon:yes stop_codon:yes gene_type:complete